MVALWKPDQRYYEGEIVQLRHGKFYFYCWPTLVWDTWSACTYNCIPADTVKVRFILDGVESYVKPKDVTTKVK